MAVAARQHRLIGALVAIVEAGVDAAASAGAAVLEAESAELLDAELLLPLPDDVPVGGCRAAGAHAAESHVVGCRVTLRAVAQRVAVADVRVAGRARGGGP